MGRVYFFAYTIGPYSPYSKRYLYYGKGILFCLYYRALFKTIVILREGYTYFCLYYGTASTMFNTLLFIDYDCDCNYGGIHHSDMLIFTDCAGNFLSVLNDELGEGI